MTPRTHARRLFSTIFWVLPICLSAGFLQAVVITTGSQDYEFPEGGLGGHRHQQSVHQVETQTRVEDERPDRFYHTSFDDDPFFTSYADAMIRENREPPKKPDFTRIRYLPDLWEDNSGPYIFPYPPVKAPVISEDNIRQSWKNVISMVEQHRAEQDQMEDTNLSGSLSASLFMAMEASTPKSRHGEEYRSAEQSFKLFEQRIISGIKEGTPPETVRNAQIDFQALQEHAPVILAKKGDEHMYRTDTLVGPGESPVRIVTEVTLKRLDDKGNFQLIKRIGNRHPRGVDPNGRPAPDRVMEWDMRVRVNSQGIHEIMKMKRARKYNGAYSYFFRSSEGS